MKPSAPKEDPELKRLQKEAAAKAAAEKASQIALSNAEESARQRGLRGFRALSATGNPQGFLGATSSASLLA